MSSAATIVAEPVESSQITTFPLERPSLRVRRRGSVAHGLSLPYFIAGPENRMVSFVAQSQSEVFELGNPILLIGQSGVGKTSIALHLAARHAVEIGDTSSAAVHYLPAVDFARQYAEAVDADDMPPLRASLDDPPVLVIDDLHLIADKASAQDELTRRIDARIQAGKATLLTCRRLPGEVRGMRPMLVSRVLPGLTISMNPPIGDARTLLLREFAIQHDLELGDDLVETLSCGLDTSLPTRSLEAAIKQLALWCRMKDSEPTIDGVRATIELIGKGDEVSLSSITNGVSRYFRLKSADLRSSSRKQQIVRARSLAMFLARRMTSKSMHQIGAYFGGRDHTTVLHAIRKTESLVEEDVDLRRAAEELTEKLAR